MIEDSGWAELLRSFGTQVQAGIKYVYHGINRIKSFLVVEELLLVFICNSAERNVVMKGQGPIRDAHEVQKEIKELNEKLKEHHDKAKIEGFVPGNFGNGIGNRSSRNIKK